MGIVTAVFGFFFDHKLGPLAAAGLGLLVLLGVWQADRYGARLAGRAEGVQQQQQKTRQANEKVVRRAAEVRSRVRAQSQSGGVRGLVDPNY